MGQCGSTRTLSIILQDSADLTLLNIILGQCGATVYSILGQRGATLYWDSADLHSTVYWDSADLHSTVYSMLGQRIFENTNFNIKATAHRTWWIKGEHTAKSCFLMYIFTV